jgi:hypothetical protein
MGNALPSYATWERSRHFTTNNDNNRLATNFKWLVKSNIDGQLQCLETKVEMYFNAPTNKQATNK